MFKKFHNELKKFKHTLNEDKSILKIAYFESVYQFCIVCIAFLCMILVLKHIANEDHLEWSNFWLCYIMTGFVFLNNVITNSNMKYAIVNKKNKDHEG